MSKYRDVVELFCWKYLLSEHSAAPKDLESLLNAAEYKAVRDYIHGVNRPCLVCGDREPCSLKDDPNSPCTFEPSPKQIFEWCTRLRKQVDRLKSMSVVELMCENENVKHHVEEWEKRCLLAESRLLLLARLTIDRHRSNAEELARSIVQASQ